MALVQVGMGLGRVVLLVGAGFTGSIVLRNGRLSDLLGELQEALSDKDAVEIASGGDMSISEAIKQVGQMAMELRQMGSQVAVVHVDSGKGVASSLVAPAAVCGVLGYGYMWWKGISFSSLMYVTRQNMANAVAMMTKNLEQVQSSLAAAKKHLTQRIQRLDDKLDQQKEISGQIRDEVTGARLKLQNIGSEMQKIVQMASGLDGKLDSIETKQVAPSPKFLPSAKSFYIASFILPSEL
ncbi:hypothetical protein GUJ93_ZPchr0008g11574 [Zizania palustris]|uniref:DUF1664 domain-containing protein n=1 Tax=Zizania palustris TaxID=103762 RepID=A0A8J5R4M1_ZIZPA|nr:hypothetical protein GUJ93_ZPchr0008g11574 [Zizania palustris]